MSDLLPRLKTAINRHALIEAGDTVVIGVSGGADSLVLLHLLNRLRNDLLFTLHAATLDHGLRGAAGAEDAHFVQRIAAAWGVPVTVGQGDVPALAEAQHLNLEEAARQMRYSFLARVARQVGAVRIAVAHHQDDQAETVLLHLIRGSGLDGLRGMLPAVPLVIPPLHMALQILISFPPLSDPGPHSTRSEGRKTSSEAPPSLWDRGLGWGAVNNNLHNERPGVRAIVLIRPLLDISRAEIAAYAAEQGLEPRHDATNEDSAYLRNRLRHEVIPLLETLNPQLRPALARMAEALRGEAELVRQAGDRALAGVLRAIRPGAAVLDRAAWGTCSPGEKRYILRAVIARLRPDLRDVGFVVIDQAVASADHGLTGAETVLPGGLRLRIDYGDLRVVSVGADQFMSEAPALSGGDDPPTFRPGDRVSWRSGAWTFEAAPLDPGDDLAALHADLLAAALAVPADSWLTLRARRSGDRFRPRGLGGHSQKLSDTLINLRVPSRWRDQVPLLVIENEIAWFVAPTADGLRARVGESFAVSGVGSLPGTVIVVVRWRTAFEKS